MSGSPRRVGIPHLPALDGLRGLAVLGVLLFHDGHLRGGYLGVDLFFVLSGYLITSLLLAEWGATARIDLAAFWVRRARRLFPALLALLLGVSLYARAVAAPSELGRIRGDSIATLAYFANWRAIYAGRSYWDLFAAPSPLEHTWSLSIEEQFYVVWPLLAFLVFRLSRPAQAGSQASPRPARALLAVSLGLSVLSAAAMWLLYSPDASSRAYMGTDTRGASILVGAALACAISTWGTLKSDRAVRALDVAGLVAAAFLGLTWARLEGQDSRLYHGGFWLTELAVLVLIGCAAHARRSFVARALGLWPLVGVGLISYGMYLWHWPIFVVLTRERLGVGGFALSALRFGATLAVSLVSFRFLEQPIRRNGLPFGKPIVVVPAAVGLVVIAVLRATVGATNVPKNVAAAEQLRALPSSGVALEGAIKVLVLGDSVAVALGERLHAVQGGTNAIVVQRGIGSCSLLHDVLPTKSLDDRPHDGGNCAQSWASDVAELRPDVTVVVLGGGFFAPVEIDHKWRRTCDAGWHAAYKKALAQRLEELRPHGGHIFLTRIPYPVGSWVLANPKRLVDCFNDTIREAAEGAPFVTLLDLQAQLCPGGNCIMESNGKPVRPDGLHFDGPGAEEIARWVLKTLL